MLRNFFFFMTGKGIAYLIPIALIPLLTRYLSPDEFGLVTLFNSITGFSSTFLSFGVAGALVRAYYDKGLEGFDFNSYALSCVIFNLIFCLFFGIVLLCAYVLGVSNKWDFIICLFIVVSCLIFQELIVKLFVVEQRAVSHSTWQIGSASLSFVITVALLLHFQLSWESRVYALGITSGLFLILSFTLFSRRGYFLVAPRASYFNQIFKFGLPLLFHGLGLLFLSVVDKFLVAHLVGLAEVGIYGIAVSYASLIIAVLMPFDQIMTPIINKNMKISGPTAGSIFITIASLYLTYAGIAAIILWYFREFAILLFAGEDYLKAAEIVAPLAVAQVFFGMYRCFVKTLFYQRRTKLVSMSTLVGGGLAIPLIVILVPVYGIKAAAVAICVGYFIALLMVCFFSYMYSPFRWALPKIHALEEILRLHQNQK